MAPGRTAHTDFTDQLPPTNIAEVTSGSYKLTIPSSQSKSIGVGNFFTSPKFTVGGLNWYVKCYPDGYYAKDKGKYLSLYLSYASETEVGVVFEFCLLDQNGNTAVSLRSRNTHGFRRPGKYKGWSKFVKREDLEKYVKDDRFEVICTVTILSPKRLSEPNSGCVIVVPPSDLGDQLGELLKSKENTDVTFLVKGERFCAHKLVLALRSPVFRAELFGTMKEHNANKITIEDMEPVIFKSLLHFIYTDALPEENELNDDGVGASGLDVQSRTSIVMQHLLVAADRYALERLKLICQDELSKNIGMETVATTLALAEQHNCPQLKTICLEFLTVQDNYSQMASTDGYQHLVLCCPSILKEIEEKHGANSFFDGVAEHSDDDDDSSDYRRSSLIKKLLFCSSTKK